MPTIPAWIQMNEVISDITYIAACIGLAIYLLIGVSLVVRRHPELFRRGWMVVIVAIFLFLHAICYFGITILSMLMVTLVLAIAHIGGLFSTEIGRVTLVAPLFRLVYGKHWQYQVETHTNDARIFIIYSSLGFIFAAWIAITL